MVVLRTSGLLSRAVDVKVEAAVSEAMMSEPALEGLRAAHGQPSLIFVEGVAMDARLSYVFAFPPIQSLRIRELDKFLRQVLSQA